MIAAPGGKKERQDRGASQEKRPTIISHPFVLAFNSGSKCSEFLACLAILSMA